MEFSISLFDISNDSNINNNVINNNYPNNDDINNNIINNSCTSKPNVLIQGQQLLNNQRKKETYLESSMKLINEPPDNYENVKYYSLEGFDTMKTKNKNNTEFNTTNKLSDDFTKNLNGYSIDKGVVIDDTRLYVSSGRNKDVKFNKDLSFFTKETQEGFDTIIDPLEKRVDLINDITADKEGCYKNYPNSTMEYQSDIKDVNVDTCKMRASDLNYSGFSIKKGATGKLGCYLTNNVKEIKENGIAAKPIESVSYNIKDNNIIESIYINENPVNKKDIIKGSRITIGDDGSLVIVDNENKIIWNSNTNKIGIITDEFNSKSGKYGRNYLLSGETLNDGEFIGSPSGNCYLIMKKGSGEDKIILNYLVVNCDKNNYGEDELSNGLFSMVKTAFNELTSVKNKVSKKITELGKTSKIADKIFVENTTKMKDEVHSYMDVRDGREIVKKHIAQLEGMNEDTDLKLVTYKYRKYLWTIMFIFILLGGMRMLKKT